MTYCTTIAKPLIKKIKEKKTLEEIGAELCGKSVKNPKQKAIRLIKELLGEEYLIEHAYTLKYDTEKAQLGKKPKKSLRKISTTADNESKESSDENQHVETITFNNEFEAVSKLVSIFSLKAIEDAIVAIKNET